MTGVGLKRRVEEAMDRRADEIIDLGERIRRQPELGFKEVTEIVDNPLAYVAPAKALAAMVVDMLDDGAAGAREVLAHARPRLTREAYLELQRGIARREIFDGASAEPSGAHARGTR